MKAILITIFFCSKVLSIGNVGAIVAARNHVHRCPEQYFRCYDRYQSDSKCCPDTNVCHSGTFPTCLEFIRPSQKCSSGENCICGQIFSRQNPSNSVTCSNGQYCAFDSGRDQVRCVADSISEGDQCRASGSCSCRVNNNGVRLYETCPRGTYCVFINNAAGCASTVISAGQKCNDPNTCLCGGAIGCQNGEDCITDGTDNYACTGKVITTGVQCDHKSGCLCQAGQDSLKKRCEKYESCLVNEQGIPFCAYISKDGSKVHKCTNPVDCMCAFSLNNVLYTDPCFQGNTCRYDESEHLAICQFPEDRLRIFNGQLCPNKLGGCLCRSEDSSDESNCDPGQKCIATRTSASCQREFKSFECRSSGECYCQFIGNWSHGKKYCVTGFSNSYEASIDTNTSLMVYLHMRATMLWLSRHRVLTYTKKERLAI